VIASPRKRAGYREPATAMVPAAKMCTTKAMTAAAEVTTAMAAAMTAAAAVASPTSADRIAGQQDRQNNDRNSDCWLIHGTLRVTALFGTRKRKKKAKVPQVDPGDGRKGNILRRRNDLPGIEDVLRIERHL
jgi:hypothetical protein